MKKVVLLLFTTSCLVGTAQASLVELSFNFDGVGSPYDLLAIQSYMQSQVNTQAPGSGVTVTVSSDGLRSYGISSATGPLDEWLKQASGDGYIADQTGPAHGHAFSFSFSMIAGSVSLASVSFDWARASDAFAALAVSDAGDVTASIVSQDEGTGTGKVDQFPLSTSGTPFTTLRFQDGKDGAIGIDNLGVTLSVVPLPASILLGMFAVGLAGRKLRKFV